MEDTPLMKQYWTLKEQAGDALLLFRMGDFYELFGDDAVVAARILEITLTSRDKNKPNPIPMAGVPHHAAQNYIQKLLNAGKKIAIGEQMEEATAGKGIVRREITRIFTPAVQFGVEGAEGSYLATAVPIASASSDMAWTVALLDSSTGEARIGPARDASHLRSILADNRVRHFLCGTQELAEIARSALSEGSSLVEALPDNYLSKEQATRILKVQYGVDQLSAFLQTDSEIMALGTLVTYACRTQQVESLIHLRPPAPIQASDHLRLGPQTWKHLDLLPGPERIPNLFDIINQTRSSLGARQLRRWMLEPLKKPSAIVRRQDAVRELSGNTLSVGRLSDELAGLYDIERIMGRINTRLANPRDTLALGKSIALSSNLIDGLREARSPLLSELREQLTELSRALRPLSDEIIRTQKDDAPLTSRDGGIFQHGKSADLDRLLSLTEDGQNWLIELETRERNTTGIPSLKVRYNRVFGYYIEVTKTHLANVPSHYQRKQSTVGAERFFTEELKKFEDEILTASARQKSLEQKYFEDLVDLIQTQTRPIMDLARILGELDALISLGRLGARPGWCFPEVDDSLDLDIQAGRHPIVDENAGGAFVPNDLSLSPQTRLTLLITGPNMGGKSTVMRQTALIILLGQMGAPVPAKKARWGNFSSLYTRIGAHDAIALGQSTFMVEMSELAHILHHADERSLILLDEIGRGTSTYDGMSVAWATLNWISKKVRARTLFATHYHELTRLEGRAPLLANAHMAVDGARRGGTASLRFLYELREGPTSDSFGIHVAKLAGIPNVIVEDAWKILEDLEKNSAKPQRPRSANPAATASQLSLFSGESRPSPLS